MWTREDYIQSIVSAVKNDSRYTARDRVDKASITFSWKKMLFKYKIVLVVFLIVVLTIVYKIYVSMKHQTSEANARIRSAFILMLLVAGLQFLTTFL
jgi:hypothetical protein